MRKLFDFERFFRRKNTPILAWFVWILGGSLFYSLYDGFPAYVAIYKSTSVGWAIGWSLPLQRAREDDSVSMLFSSLHNYVGVIFVGLSVIYIAEEIANSKEDWTVQLTNRRSLKDQEVSSVCGRLKRWCLLHKVQMRLAGISLGLIVVATAGGAAVDEYNLAEALDMMLSTLSCCGYRGLPENGVAPYGYILLAVYTNLAVPILAIALASLISMAVDTPDEKFFYSKIAAPLTDKEIKFMQTFGIDDGDGLLDTKEFVVLTIIRVGNVAPQLVLDIIARFKVITSTEESSQIPYASIEGYLPAPSSPRRGIRQTLIEQFTRRSSVAPPPLMERPSEASTPKPNLSPNSTAHSTTSASEGLQLLNNRNPPRSAINAINKRKERRETARRSIIQRKAVEAKSRASIREAHEGATNNVQSHNVPFPSPFGRNNSKNKVAPHGLDICIDIDERPEYKQDGILHENEEYSNLKVEINSNEKHAIVSCSDMMMQRMEGDDESDKDGEEDHELEDITKAEEHDKDDMDDHAIEEVRRPSEIVESPEPTSEQLEQALRTRTLSMEMDTESIVKEPSTFSYKNSALVRRRSERRDTFIPSGTYGIISLQNRKKSVTKLQRKRSIAKIVQRPSILAKTARKSTVQKLKKSINDRTNVRASTLQRMKKINAAHIELMKKQLTLQQRISESDDLCFVLLTLLQVLLSDPYVQAFLVWLLWLLAAALFYCLKMNLSFYRGFYMSVNVGYAIYWTQEETDGIEKTFSILHIIVGQIIVSFALAAFAHTLTNSSKEWYTAESEKAEASTPSKFNLLQMQKSMRWTSSTFVEDDESFSERSHLIPIKTMIFGHMKVVAKRLHYFYTQNKVHFFLLLYVVFGVVWSSLTVQWPLIEGLYFTITSLSTGGIWSIPDDSKDIMYFIVAIFTCTGAPIMCLSGGVFAHRMSRIGEAAYIQKTINAAITLEELGMMNQLDIDDGDGFIDETEYIILILVRLKAIRPELIAAILARFRHLDADGLGAIPYEIFQMPDKRGSVSKGDDSDVNAGLIKVGK